MSIKSILQKAGRDHRDSAAIVVQSISYTYGQLFDDAAASRCALQKAGLSGNVPVAIFGMRTYFTYVGIISAILSGAFYLPTNPGFPPARNSKILNKAGAKYAFLDCSYLDVYIETLNEHSGLTVVINDKDKLNELQNTFPQHNFILPARGENIEPPEPLLLDYIYLLFTSGSTGEPKGVAINNANVENYIKATSLRYEIKESDRFIQLFDLTFDLSAHNIFLAFANGASLYIVDDKELINPLPFARNNRITQWASVPTVLNILDKFRLLKENVLPDIKYSMFCGEALPYNLAASWSKSAPNSMIENIYGPTECTIACTYHEFDEDISQKHSVNGLVPIGYPYDGVKTKIVDSDMCEIKNGGIGELLLAGKQLADGYYNNPSITAEKFISLDGDIFYKTGDLVKDSPVGIVFVGRLDSQVKIKGFRVELSEIENEAAKYIGSNMLVALPVPVDSSNHTGVVLFASNNGLWEKEATLAQLAEALPAYMVPTDIIALDDFPRNSSGKIDRNKLKGYIK